MVTYVEKSREFRGSLNEVILSEGLEIPGYEDYLIFKEGLVVSLKGNPRVLKLAKCGYKKHYSFVVLCRGGKTKAHYIHRLVAQAFIPNPLGLEQVNHIDGDTSNNTASNLEWITPAGNSQHAMKTGLSPRGASCPWAKHTEDTVRMICAMLSRGLRTSQIRAFTGISSKLICKIKSRKQWTAVSCEYDF